MKGTLRPRKDTISANRSVNTNIINVPIRPNLIFMVKSQTDIYRPMMDLTH